MSEIVKSNEVVSDDKVASQVSQPSVEAVQQDIPEIESKNDIVNALKEDFGTIVNRIYINSLGRHVSFREISVVEQKTLSRTMIQNENRKDITFDAQCGLINRICLEPDFDIYKLTEFDRLKLMIAVYQVNMFKNKITFTCPSCNAENVYTLDFENTLARLDDIDISPKKFEYENRNWKYEFTVAYPSVKYIAKFYRDNAKRNRGVRKPNTKNADIEASMDYVDLYIKELTFLNKTTGKQKTIKLYNYEPHEVEEIISVFPQDVLYSENGIMKYITNEFIKKINDSFDQQKCFHCGEVYENTVTNSASFF